MAANGIEVDKKGRPAFQTNRGWRLRRRRRHARPRHRGGGHRRRRGASPRRSSATPYTYDIPEQAYVTKADAEAKKGILQDERRASAARATAACSAPPSAKTARTPAPTAPTWPSRMADGSHQILHVDKMCNECGNCTQFCPYASEPCHDKFTLFQTAEDMADSHNAGVLFLGGDKVRVRTFGEPKDYDLCRQKRPARRSGEADRHPA